MKILTICLLLSILPLFSQGQDSPETITTKFFDKYKNADFGGAIDYLFSTTKNSSDLKDGIEKLKIDLGSTTNILGT